MKTDPSAFAVQAASTSKRIQGIGLNLDGSDFMSDFALAGAVAMSIGDNRLGTLSLKGTREVALRLARCAVDSYKRFPPDPFAGLSPTRTPSPSTQPRPEPTRARANLGSLISQDDYPADAIRKGEQGVVGYRLSVGANGRVTSCQVTSSSGSSSLDEATCRLLQSRARFTPARDSNGNPTTDTVSARMVWTLPQ